MGDGGTYGHFGRMADKRSRLDTRRFNARESHAFWDLCSAGERVSNKGPRCG